MFAIRVGEKVMKFDYNDLFEPVIHVCDVICFNIIGKNNIKLLLSYSSNKLEKKIKVWITGQRCNMTKKIGRKKQSEATMSTMRKCKPTKRYADEAFLTT